MQNVTGTSGAATINAAAQTSQAEEIRQSTVQVDGQSTIASAKEPEERGFFGPIVDRVVGVFSWIKGKIVAFFSYIFCCSTDEAKATQITQLTEKKTQVDTTHANFIKARNEGTLKDTWKATFEALPQDLQDALIKEDLAEQVRDKYTDANELAKRVEADFKNEAIKNKAIRYIKDLEELNDHNIIPAKVYSAVDDVPNYLQHISSDLAKQISALQETAAE